MAGRRGSQSTKGSGVVTFGSSLRNSVKELPACRGMHKCADAVLAVIEATWWISLSWVGPAVHTWIWGRMVIERGEFESIGWRGREIVNSDCNVGIKIPCISPHFSRRVCTFSHCEALSEGGILLVEQVERSELGVNIGAAIASSHHPNSKRCIRSTCGLWKNSGDQLRLDNLSVALGSWTN